MSFKLDYLLLRPWLQIFFKVARVKFSKIYEKRRGRFRSKNLSMADLCSWRDSSAAMEMTMAGGQEQLILAWGRDEGWAGIARER
jgi:hypothetical protein